MNAERAFRAVHKESLPKLKEALDAHTHHEKQPFDKSQTLQGAPKRPSTAKNPLRD